MPDDAWFEIVAAEASLTQGDLIADCPLLGWKREAAAGFDNPDATFDLASLARPISSDVVVMTQACDLEQKKVSDVVLCPASLSLDFAPRGSGSDRRRRKRRPRKLGTGNSPTSLPDESGISACSIHFTNIRPPPRFASCISIVSSLCRASFSKACCADGDIAVCASVHLIASTYRNRSPDFSCGSGCRKRSICPADLDPSRSDRA